VTTIERADQEWGVRSLVSNLSRDVCICNWKEALGIALKLVLASFRLAKLLKGDGVSVYTFNGGSTINNGRSHKYIGK
jgi:hypothetical protein